MCCVHNHFHTLLLSMQIGRPSYAEFQFVVDVLAMPDSASVRRRCFANARTQHDELKLSLA